MPCSHPIKIENDSGPAMVACGRCHYCRVRRKLQWVGRLCMEAADHSEARFVTLTYKPELQPSVLDYEDFKLFMKRYRYYYGECRFFAVGEYGDRHGNGHWHAIIFGHAQRFRGHWLDNKAWTSGFSFDGSCTTASIGYVSGYALKGNVDGVRRPITRMSLVPGIGFPRIGRLAKQVAESFRSERLPAWPNGYHFGASRYPLCAGGLEHFKKEFSKAGGLAPLDPNPDQNYYAVMEALGDLGSRLRSERKFNANHMHRRNEDGVKKTARERF